MNVDWISRLPAPARAIGYFTLQRLIGSRVATAWRDFRRWTRYSRSELNDAVESRLGHTLQNALLHSSHYRELGLARRTGESAVEFLRRFPILTREDLRDQFTRIVADSLQAEITGPESRSRRRYDWLVVKTGGTTGTPTAVIHDGWFRDCGRATRLFSQQLCGFPLGTRYFRLWGSEQDLMQSAEKLDRRILRNLLGEVPMNAFRARESELRAHLATFESRPDIRHLMTYVDAAASLALFIEDHRLPAPRLDTIMACAGTVTAEWRELLTRVFRADVFDKYGSRECADIACECPAHTGLHVYSPNVHVEVVNDEGNPVSAGETGRILVTLLNNHSFPMIRYAIGDLAVAADNSTPCPCGLPFPRLDSIQGREDDMLTTESGTRMTSGLIRHLVGVSLNRGLIREWQLEQTRQGHFVFRHVPLRTPGLDENLAGLQAVLLRALGEGCRLDFQQVPEIPPAATGKTRWIINRINQGGTQNPASARTPRAPVDA